MTIRKFAVAAAAVAAFTTAFAAPSSDEVSDQGVGAIGWTPFQIGVFSPVSFPWGCDWDIKGADISFLYAETCRLQGLNLCGVATRTRDEMRALNITGFFNWHEMDAYGIDLTLGVNFGLKDFYGVFGGAFGLRQNMSGLDVNFLGAHQNTFRGVQLAGLCNFTLDEFTGVDVALGLNMTKKMTGAQLGGINFAHQLKGCQLGFFNIAEECPNGIQLGLINIILDNTIKVLPITNFYFEF